MAACQVCGVSGQGRSPADLHPPAHLPISRQLQRIGHGVDGVEDLLNQPAVSEDRIGAVLADAVCGWHAGSNQQRWNLEGHHLRRPDRSGSAPSQERRGTSGAECRCADLITNRPSGVGRGPCLRTSPRLPTESSAESRRAQPPKCASPGLGAGIGRSGGNDHWRFWASYASGGSGRAQAFLSTSICRTDPPPVGVTAPIRRAVLRRDPWP